MSWFWIVIAIGYLIIRFAISSGGGGANEVSEDELGELDLRLRHDWEDLEDGETLELLRLELDGTIGLPYAGMPVRLVYSMTDITDPDEKLPVICHIDDYTDGETPIFWLEHELNIQYQISRVEGMELPPVPTAALAYGRRGKRRIKVTVHIVDPSDNTIYAYGEAFTTQTQSDYGYLEQGERNTKTDRAIASLGLAICAGDGHIDKRETQAIKRYFSEQFTGIDEEDLAERKESLNQAMRELMTDAKENLSKLSLGETAEEIRRRAEVIAEFNSEPLNHAAYQLAMQIVAADDQLEEAELAIVKVIADTLEIPAEVDAEMRDRYLKLAMFESADHATALNMPEQLSAEEEKAFLNSEYDKWRRRATHSDPKVREEANARLAAVTKARRELEARGEDQPNA